jgi:GTP-binding protein
MTARPAVAVVGIPNAGKSTLINRLSGTRTAVVHETPGVTRDRKAVPAEWCGLTFDLIDTGGFDEDDEHPLAAGIREQVKAAVRDADLVLFVVDARVGPLPADHVIADVLRRAGTPVLLAANKLDDTRADAMAAALYELGVGDPLPVSAVHGTGSGELLDAIVAHLRELRPEESEDAEEAVVPVAIVGRPNAGKSSLFNAIVGEPRTIVSDIPGTTRDAIDTTVENRHGRFLFVDTAGMRKAARVSGVEYYSYLRSLQTLDRAHVAVVVADATVGIGELDLSIATEATRRGCATVIAYNKWDLERPSLPDARGLASRKLRQKPQVLPVSAVRHHGLAALLDALVDLDRRYAAHVQTAQLNRILSTLGAVRPAPARKGRRLKIYYGAQYGTAPPRFALEVNDRRLVTRDYGYFVENRLRAELGLEGVPLIIDFKTS